MQVVLFDVQQRITLGELSTPFVKYVVWSKDMNQVKCCFIHATTSHRCSCVQSWDHTAHVTKTEGGTTPGTTDQTHRMMHSDKLFCNI